MKKILCAFLALIMALSFPIYTYATELINCSFEEGSEIKLTLHGNAKTVFDSDINSNVLYLDGSSGTYAEFPAGTFGSTDVTTILFDIKPTGQSGNFFTFTIGQDSNTYAFFRIRGNEARYAITGYSYENEQEAKTTLPYTNGWLSVALVLNSSEFSMYINGCPVTERQYMIFSLRDLGDNLLSYLGKSFYSGDSYFRGYFDNVRVFDRALQSDDIKNYVLDSIPFLGGITFGSLNENINSPDENGTDSHTAVYAEIDRDNRVITPYVKSSQSLKETPLYIATSFSDCEVVLNGKDIESFPCTIDLTRLNHLWISRFGYGDEDYAIVPAEIAKNPVLSGQYADPDIAVFDGRFWLFPTTDGTPGWAGTQFHAFSSLDLVNWIDEGVILDVKEKTSKKNARGVNIAVSPWSDINAWAPAVAEKNGKYYFYYCSNIAPEYTALYGNGMAIGAAWANSPNGPYTALDKPLLYPKMLEESGTGFSGQVIDPSIFTDEDGTSYILFGNGNAAYAKLNSDMLSVDKNSLSLIYGLNDFRESVAVFKRNGIYYYTWSCDDTGSENYHVNWGYAKSFGGEIKNKGTLIEKDASNGILGTGHQSVLYLPESDKCFIAYHRFYTPLGQVNGNYGFHRETCIDEITFQPGLGTLIPDSLIKVTPTYGGTGAYNTSGENISEIAPTHYTPEAPSSTTPPQPAVKKITVKKTAIKKLIRGRKKFTVKWKKVSGVTGYQIQYSLKKNMKKSKKKTVKGAKKYKLTVKKLKAKKKYYVRIRAYKKYKGKTYYSKWSKVKAVRTK